jgi:2'-5' RNA ligase
MKSVFRAFIAMDMSSEVLRRIDETSAELQARLGSLPVRWIPAAHVHLTLKFLGDGPDLH